MDEPVAHAPDSARPEPKRSPTLDAETRRCYLCKRELPIAAFRTITSTERRGPRVYRYTQPSHDCRDCNREYKRAARRRKAEAVGRSFGARGDRAAREAASRQREADRRAERQRSYQAYLDEQERVRQHRRESPELECLKCHASKPRGDFYPSQLMLALCRACIDAESARRFQQAKDSLADSYVKRRIANATGLRHAQIPAVMVEAKRAQLMIDRAMPPTDVLYRLWLAQTLEDAPIVDATHLNQLATAAGFCIRELRPVRRQCATYEANTNTWRLR
jgi:hypothetical protein